MLYLRLFSLFKFFKIIQFFPELLNFFFITIQFSQNYSIFLKLFNCLTTINFLNIIQFSQNSLIFSKFFNFLKIPKFCQNSSIFSKLSNFLKIIQFTQNYSISSKLFNLFRNVSNSCDLGTNSLRSCYHWAKKKNKAFSKFTLNSCSQISTYQAVINFSPE